MIYLIGTGTMAVDYAKVLQQMAIPFTVIGRGEASAKKFEEQTGIAPIIGGVEQFLSEYTIEKKAKCIIATGTEALMPTLLLLVKNGIDDILVEKPAAISIQELIENATAFESCGTSIYVAYNRRFYASVIETQRLIAEDGGLLSMHFEFTEWAHRIEPLEKAPGVKENWFFANSTHVIDTAFYLGGTPTQICSFTAGNVGWHQPSIFSGAGMTENGVLFSYFSNWESAGRWSIELLTKNRKIILCPLETVKTQQKGSILIEEHRFDDSLDKQFKPGLYLQVQAFLGDKQNLLTLNNHLKKTTSIYAQVAESIIA
ncbi:MAG: hypothetical protein K1X55_16530 [Chitinophagales bacterium]|nr:hypothetical protein [Chitinophagales bacterium]